jgi:hypothetical protein
MQIKLFFTFYLILSSFFLFGQSEEYEVREISSNFFENRKLELDNINKDSLDVKKALKLLYPGRYYEETQERGNDIYEDNFMAWSCKKCAEESFDIGDGEISEFPFQNNYTQIIGFTKYRQNNNSYILLGFSTFHSVPASGRYSHGILGLAVFKKNSSNKWELTNFTPNVCGQGSFGRAHFPSETTQISNNFNAFVLTGGNANGVSTDEIINGVNNFRVYAEIDNKIQEVINIEDGRCYTMYENRKKFGSNWETKIIPQLNSISGYPNIELITSGTYDKTVGEYYTPKVKELERYTNLSKYKFEWKRVYEFINNHYEISESKIKIISK